MSKVVYYSPFGGEVHAVLNAEDSEYEESLRAGGTPFRKATVTDSKIKAVQITGAKFNKEKGEVA